MRAERKRAGLIASLVESLQQDEKLEETKKGRYNHIKRILFYYLFQDFLEEK